MQKKSAVLQFIDEERAKGKDDQQIQHALLDAGWHMDIIQSAMHKKESTTIHTKPVSKESRLDWYELVANPLFWGGVFAVLLILALFI